MVYRPVGRLCIQATAAAIAVVLAACAFAAPATSARVTTKKAIWGPLERNGVSQFPIYADLGVGILQMAMPWHDVAPTRPRAARDPDDPAYRWPAAIQNAVEQGRLYGVRIAVMVTGTPEWANGGRSSNWAPRRPLDYARFLTAAARRYPEIRHWIIWGEPSKARNFQPLPADGDHPLRGAERRGPRIYARMLDAAYASLKAVSPDNLVIGGNTYTVGTVLPRYFIRALRLPNGRSPRMDLYGHNPFSKRPPTLHQPSLGRGYADFADLDSLAHWIDRDLPDSAPRGRRLRLFLSEYSLPTDHRNFDFGFYVSRAVQARWIADGLRIARRWSRIYTYGYLGLYDDPLRPDGLQVERGLLDREGRRKPAYAAFKRG